MRTARFHVVTCLGLGLGLASPCLAQESTKNEPVKIGFSVPLTGAFAENGKQMTAALKLYVEQNGSVVAGRKIEILLRDDGGVADVARRQTQELIVNDKVNIMATSITSSTKPNIAVAPKSFDRALSSSGLASRSGTTFSRTPLSSAECSRPSRSATTSNAVCAPSMLIPGRNRASECRLRTLRSSSTDRFVQFTGKYTSASEKAKVPLKSSGTTPIIVHG